jgi:hypothetical protein
MNSRSIRFVRATHVAISARFSLLADYIRPTASESSDWPNRVDSEMDLPSYANLGHNLGICNNPNGPRHAIVAWVISIVG